MLSEEFFSSVSGPPVAANTAVSRDIGVYHHALTPSLAVKASYKKSSTSPHGLAVSDTHIFAAQEQKAQVHVYSLQRGNQETFVSFPSRIRCVALAGDVLVLGTVEGRLILWETCTGRQVVTPPCHVQAVSCLRVAPHHILSASEDSNINVWPLLGLLALDAPADLEPELTLSNHRAAVTSLDVGPSGNGQASICVSVSKDKTCILWNYRTGQALRTLLFPSPLTCIQFDPTGRCLAAASEACAVYLVELFGQEPLLGSMSAEMASIVVPISEPLGVTDPAAGPATCLAMTYDGAHFLTGHTKGSIIRWSLTGDGQPSELVNLNASVTNIHFRPLLSTPQKHRTITVSKPNQVTRQYKFSSQLEGNATSESRFSKLLNEPGFSAETILRALSSFETPVSTTDDDEESRKIDENLWMIMNNQRHSLKSTWSG